MEIHVWDHPDFGDLNQTLKLFDWFVRSKCDNIGVYHHNRRLAEFHCEGGIDLQKYIDTLNRSKLTIERLGDDLLWRLDFVRETWGTITAETNLGKSCWRLLIKHGLAERFIDAYPDCIKIETFREAIKKGELPAIQPQGSNRSVTENTVSEELQPQGSKRAGTYNYSYNDNNTSNSTSSKNDEKEGLDIEGIVREGLQEFYSEPDELLHFDEFEEGKKIVRALIFTEKVAPDEVRFHLKRYLKGEKMRLKETDEEPEPLDIFKNFSFKTETE